MESKDKRLRCREDRVATWETCPKSEKQEACRLYYAEFFPYAEMARFLCERASGHREEFSAQLFAFFGLSGRVIERHAFFVDPKAWRDAVVQRDVARMEIGPIYLAEDPTRRHVEDRSPLAFDMDVEDYADVLPCESLPDKTTGLDEISWRHLLLSTTLLDLFLELVAFRHDDEYRSLATFSGRRGIHLWVPDRYRDWWNGEAIGSLLSAIERLQDQTTRALHMVAVLRGHPSGQLFLGHARRYAREAFRDGSPFWERSRAGQLRSLFAAAEAGMADNEDALDAAAVMLLAPRPDKQVSRSYKHLLKSPFSVHPGSGNISLPVELHLETLPSLEEVRADVRSVGGRAGSFQRALDVLKTFVD